MLASWPPRFFDAWYDAIPVFGNQSKMTILILGLVLFIGIHLTKEVGVKPALVSRLGSEGAYKGVYSLLALFGLMLIVWGKSSAPFIMLWAPKFELKFISHIVMIPAAILFIAGNVPRSHFKYFLRNPMLAGTALWGVAHLWSNGDLASTLLFGSFTAWASFKFFALRNEVTIDEETAPKLYWGIVRYSKHYLFWDIVTIATGLIVYILIGRYHGELFGIALAYI